MMLWSYPFTWGSGLGGGGGPAGPSTEQWIHPGHSRPERVTYLGQLNQSGAFTGRVRADTDPDLDTFFGG